MTLLDCGDGRRHEVIGDGMDLGFEIKCVLMSSARASDKVDIRSLLASSSPAIDPADPSPSFPPPVLQRPRPPTPLSLAPNILS